MAKKLHWTQRSQARRKEGKAIRDSPTSTTWERGYGGGWGGQLTATTGLGAGSKTAFGVKEGGEGLPPQPSGGYDALGFTDPKTKIRRVIFNGTDVIRDELVRLGYKRVNFNASIREKDVKRDYKFKKHTTKQGFFMNRPVFRLKK